MSGRQTHAAASAPDPFVDAPAPDYLEETYPVDGFPRFVWFDGPPELPGSAWTTETTHRDGQQGGLPLDPVTSLRIYDILCAFTGSSGAIRQAEFFVYRDADRSALEAALERWRSGAPIEPTTWIRARRDDVARVAHLGVRETGMLASASDYHTFHKFQPGGRAAAARAYLEAVEMALDAGLRPRLHLEDATRAPLDFMLPFVSAALELADRYGPRQRPKFRVCDTMGVGLPFPGVAAPRGVPALVAALRGAGLQPEDLEFHPHNDTGLVVANSLAAVMAGCAAVNGTCLGKGERTGNAPLEQVLVHLIGLDLVRDGAPDFAALNALVDLYSELSEPVPPRYPLYGRDAHRTRAGIHADGLRKFWRMYAPFDVPRLLGRPFEVSLTSASGLAGLAYVIEQHTGIAVAKDHPALKELWSQLMGAFDAGRMTAVDWEEIEADALQIVDSDPRVPRRGTTG